MAGFTNKGKGRLLVTFFRNTAFPGAGAFKLALGTSSIVLSPTTDLWGDASVSANEIATGNGYAAGGAAVARNATDFDVFTEDGGSNITFIQIKDIVWTASGGPIPSSGSGARKAILTDDNVTAGSREVVAFWDLGADRTVSDGQSLTLQDAELRLTE